MLEALKNIAVFLLICAVIYFIVSTRISVKNIEEYFKKKAELENYDEDNDSNE